MGRAIAREPQVYLMDEPLSNLDAKLRVHVRAEIGRLQRASGITTIYVTHDQTEALTLGDFVAVMRHGVVQQVAPPEVLFDHPANLFVAGFIGYPTINLVEATVRVEGNAVFLEFGRHRLRVDHTLVQRVPNLTRLASKSVIVGIRPQDIDTAKAGIAPPDACLDVRVELRESLGREEYLHFTLDVPPVVTEDMKELAADTDSATVTDLQEQASAHVNRFVACTSARTGAREGVQLRLAVDTSSLLFFDPATGEAIPAGQTPDETARREEDRVLG